MNLRFCGTALFAFLLLCIVVPTLMARRHESATPPAAPGPSGYHVAKSIPVPGDTGWDYLTVDAANRRVPRET